MRSRLPLLCYSESHAREGRRALVISASAFDPSRIRAFSLDVPGILLDHSEPVIRTYSEAAIWARVPDPPTEAQLKPAYKAASEKMRSEFPCFG